MPASDVFKLREPIQFLSQQHLIPTIRRNATTTHKLHRIHRPHPPTDRRPPKKTLKHVTRQRKRLEHAHREFRLPFPRLNPVVAQIPLLTTRPQRRRAQNRASQRAFRERKEKHVQHLEHELEELESRHRTLARSYTDLDSSAAKLKQEVKQLRSELESAKGSGEEGSSNNEPSPQSPNYFDPFASDGFFSNGTDLGF